MAAKKKMTFEEKLASVEALISQMETGTSSIEDSVRQYEAGITMLRELEKELQNVEQRLTVIRRDEHGQMTEEPLEVGE